MSTLDELVKIASDPSAFQARVKQLQDLESAVSDAIRAEGTVAEIKGIRDRTAALEDKAARAKADADDYANKTRADADAYAASALADSQNRSADLMSSARSAMDAATKAKDDIAATKAQLVAALADAEQAGAAADASAKHAESLKASVAAREKTLADKVAAINALFEKIAAKLSE